jgi:cytochrome c-type protein NapC/trimethylamine-N-oxide reductase cytochrome c-type subunit TorC
VGFAFALFCFVAINAALEYTSTSPFCGVACHEMGPAYRTWELSTHGANKYGFRVECIECHLPPKDKFFTHLAAKSYTGAKDIYKHYLGPDYDLEKTRKMVLDQISSHRCLHCHDSLLLKPGSSASMKAHLEAVNEPLAPENRCVVCHEDAGHQRLEKLFSP